MCAYDREHLVLNDDDPRADIYSVDWGNTFDDFDGLHWEAWLAGPNEDDFESFERDCSKY